MAKRNYSATNKSQHVSAPDIYELAGGLSAVTELFSDAFLLFDKNLNLVSANSSGRRLLGLPQKAAHSGAGQNLLDLMPSIRETSTYDEILLVLESGKSYAKDAFILPTKAGDLCLNIRAIKIQEHIGIAASDLTGHAGIIDSLKESENKFREALIENALDPVIIINRDGTIGYKSPAIEHVLGYRPEDDIGRSSFDFVHPDDLSGAFDAFALLGQTPGFTMHHELRARHADSTWHVLQIIGRNLLDNPAVEGVVASFRDVTDERIAQDELRESEERFRNVLNNSIDMIYRLNLVTGHYDYVSPSSEQLLGYSPEEFKALGIEHAAFQVHPDDLDRLSANIIDLMSRSKRENAASTIEYRIKHEKSGYRWVSDNRSVVFGEEDTPIAVVGNLRNITERKHAEEALQQSEVYFRSLIENSLEAIAIIDGKGLLTYESPSFERLLGYKSDEHIGKSPFDYVHTDDIKRASNLFAELMLNPGDSVRSEMRVWHNDGSLRIVEVVGQNLLDNPAVGGIVANIRDITESKRAEEELKQLYRQERELRQQLQGEIKRRVEFTRALAHELKTPLTSVLASSDLLASEVHDEPLLTLAKNIQQGASNLDGRIDELLDLARGEVGMLQLKLEPIDIAQLLQQTAESITAVASKRGQTLALSLPLSLPPARADATRLLQIVTNLLNNAIKFTPVGGNIKLAARQKDVSIIIEVKDTGRGISKEDQKWLFEPYHRLQKEPSVGLGLGLALCKTLVELHGGQIWVKSNVGRGSTFGFSLPLAEPYQQVVESEKPIKLWKVLLIEDDQEIVSSVSVAFQMRWSEAELLSTGLGEEGLELIEAENPDLVILDLGLPDIDGFDVLRQIRLFSSVPIVILTVKSEEADMVKGLELGADDYVVKPFRQLELLARLKVQIRKQATFDEEAPITVGSLRLNPSTFQLTYGNREISLTLVEGRIMQYLMQETGHVITHSRLAEAVWEEDYPGAVDSLRVYIRHLREKLEVDPSNPKLILTKVGVGYMLSKPVQS